MNRVFLVLILLLPSVAVADVPSACDFRNGEWQMFSRVSEGDKQYFVNDVVEKLDTGGNKSIRPVTPLKIEILKGGKVVICYLVPEDGLSIVIPKGFNPEVVHDGLKPYEMAWFRNHLGSRFPIISRLSLDITRKPVVGKVELLKDSQKKEFQEVSVGGENIVLVIQDGTIVALSFLPKKGLSFLPSSSIHDLRGTVDEADVVSQAPSQWVPVIPLTTKGESGFRKSVRKVVDGKDGEEECHAWCYVAKGMVIGGVSWLAYEVLKQTFGHNKTSAASPPSGPQGPTSPAGFVISGQM